ncbi:MAG: helix-turn-helix domain-containing protein [Actinobacteria bacterium]|nr:helix-turn-helix domain-containing protein [Actinomycetota bacterium]
MNDPPLQVQASGPARLIDAGEAAEILAVSREWVLAQARAGRIPHVRLGRYVRFERNELETWWRRRRRGPGV